MKRNTRDTRGQCTRRRKVINLKGIKPASHRTPGVRDKLAARPPSSPVYSNDSNARGLRSLWRPRRRNLDPRNTMDPRYVRGFVRARPSVARFQTQLSLFVELEVEKKRIIWILGTFWIIEIRKELGFSFFFFFDAWYWIESVDGISFREWYGKMWNL